MKRLIRPISTFAIGLILCVNAFATTWSPQEFTCPIDNEKNTFQVVMSYGSYIYSWPSKYQWLFWPSTDSPTFYMCKKCHLATYMWDFDKLPKDKLVEIKKVLAGIKVSKQFKEYNEIPITERLEVMEKVYSVLNKDEAWWENFYRLKGYHYGKDGDTAKAAEARTRSLDLLKKKLADDKDTSSKKLLLYISGAMRHFIGDDAGAISDLEKALKTAYTEKDGKPDAMKNAEAALNERINDYLARIRSEKDKPRMFDRYSADEH